MSGLRSESLDKYKANKDYFKDVEEFISDLKASIQQFANYLEAVNNKIKTSLIEKRYLTDDGNSLGAVNQMMMDTEAFSNEMVRATPMPISLKEAY